MTKFNERIANYSKTNNLNGDYVKEKMAKFKDWHYDYEKGKTIFDVSNGIDRDTLSEYIGEASGFGEDKFKEESDFLFDIFDLNGDGMLDTDELDPFNEKDGKITGFDFFNKAISFTEEEFDRYTKDEKPTDYDTLINTEMTSLKSNYDNEIKELETIMKTLDSETEKKQLSEKIEAKKAIYSAELQAVSRKNSENYSAVSSVQTKYVSELEKMYEQYLDAESTDTKSAIMDKINELMDEYNTKLDEAAKTKSNNNVIVTSDSEAYKTNSTSEANTANTTSTQTANTDFQTTLPDALAEKLDAKLGAGFSAKLEQICQKINCDPRDLIGLMQSESGISASIGNPDGGGVGLIQFLPSSAKVLGTTSYELANMSAVDQLDYVLKHFEMTKPYGFSKDARLSAGDLYALTFLPAVSSNEVLCTTTDSLSWAYRANKPLDRDGDGKITKTDLGQRVKAKYEEVLKQYGIS